MAAMERDYVYPKLADRASPTVWAEMGARAASDVAREKARELLAGPDPMYLDAATDGAIRAKYEIFLNTMPKERSA
jgi:trimethylamine--corrinoid protein Co-methyltransferase